MEPLVEPAGEEAKSGSGRREAWRQGDLEVARCPKHQVIVDNNSSNKNMTDNILLILQLAGHQNLLSHRRILRQNNRRLVHRALDIRGRCPLNAISS